jgi:HK97 family phage portal protein
VEWQGKSRRGWFRRSRGEHEDRTLSASNVPPVMLESTPGGPVTVNRALGVADVWACVRVLSDAAASVPLIPYRRTQDGRVRSDGALADLLRNPGPATTQSALMGQAMAHLQLYGNAYVGKWRDADSKVVQLALLSPDRVRPELRRGQPVYTVSNPDGAQTEHGVEDILHIRAPLSLDGLVGLSPIKQCRVALGLADSLAEHAAGFFEGGGRPDGILKVPAGSGDAADRIKAKWQTTRGGSPRAGRGIAVVTGDISFEQVSGPLDDLQFIEQRAFSTAEIARLFRVPPWMVGAASGDSLTYSNTESQALAFVTFSLRPWLVCIEQAITSDPDLCRGNQYVEFLLDALLRADSKTRAEVYALALDPDKGWLTRPEVRRLENLEPEDATDGNSRGSGGGGATDGSARSET